MSNSNVLIVEDNKTVAETLKKGLEERSPDIEVQVIDDFDKALSLIRSQTLHEIIILDLYEDGYNLENLSGQRIWETIWSERFIPIVIYTGGEVVLDPEPPDNNPFICVIQKGAGSEIKVAEYLESIYPFLQSLRSVRDEVNIAVQTVLKEVAPLIWNLLGEKIEDKSTILVRLTRRRLAARMDMETLLDERTLKAWEQYVFPPLENNLLTGDVLFRSGQDRSDPTSYRIVLSPSCDLFVRSNSGATLDRVLAAKCESLDKFVKSVISVGGIKKNKLKERMPRFLNEPQIGGYLPLPSIEGIFPPMAANLKDLDLIPIGDISFQEENDQKYLRLASIDSPFREHIVWAFLTISGRPGIPPRSLDDWAEEIISAYEE